MEHYGELFRSTRKAKGLLIKDLVVKTGLSYQTIAKIENGVIYVGFNNLLKLAKELNIVIEITAPIQTHQKWSEWVV